MIIKLHIPIIRFNNKKSQHQLDLLRKVPDPRVVQKVSCISQEMGAGQVNITQLMGDLDIIGDNNICFVGSIMRDREMRRPRCGRWLRTII
jgi:hypothetical protein